MRLNVRIDLRKTMKRVLSLLLIIVLHCAAIANAETVPGDLSVLYADQPHFEFEGNTYRLRKRLTLILFAGTDQGEDSQGFTLGARNGGQADFILLLVIDDAQKRITPIQINRDTMTEITILNVMGNVSGTRVAQICLAHGFGDGKEQSCELLASAVSRYLKGTPIDHYFVMQLDGLSAMNDVLGGVEVTLEDDFSAYDPDMTPGKTIILNAEQTEIYLRQRYSIGDQTNLSRQNRQKTYILAAADKVMAKIEQNTGFIDTFMDAMQTNTVTDMSRGRMINMAHLAQKYEVGDVISIAGETTIGDNGFVQFITDEDALTKLLIDVCYQKID